MHVVKEVAQQGFSHLAGRTRAHCSSEERKHCVWQRRTRSDGVLAFAGGKNQSDVGMKVVDIDVREENGGKIVVSSAKDDKKDNDGTPLVAKASVKG